MDSEASKAMRQSDHDLLITLHEQVKGIRSDIKDLTEGTSYKITDHELRIRRLETWGFISIGALTVAEFALNYFHPWTK